MILITHDLSHWMYKKIRGIYDKIPNITLVNHKIIKQLKTKVIGNHNFFITISK